jgi:hypothetical protein
MVHNILDNGKMIDKMEKEKKSGQMELVIKDNIKMEKKMGKVHLNGLMDLFILEISFKIIYKVKENIVGKMVENM